MVAHRCAAGAVVAGCTDRATDCVAPRRGVSVAEYMTDDDRVMIIRRWWSENGTALVLTIVLSIAAVVGWRWYNEYVKTRDEAASATYTRYLEARQRDAKAEEVATLLATMDKDYRTSAYRVFT